MSFKNDNGLIGILSQEKQPNSQSSISESDKDLINYIFEELSGMRPAFQYAWPSNDQLNAAKRQWTKALIEHNVTGIEQIELGLKKCRAIKGNFISSPAEFIALCKPEPKDIGAPDIHTAFKNAALNSSPYHRPKTWLHPLVHEAAKRTTTWAMSHEPEKVVWPIFKAHYEELCSYYVPEENVQQIQDYSTAIQFLWSTK